MSLRWSHLGNHVTGGKALLPTQTGRKGGVCDNQRTKSMGGELVKKKVW